MTAWDSKYFAGAKVQTCIWKKRALEYFFLRSFDRSIHSFSVSVAASAFVVSDAKLTT